MHHREPQNATEKHLYIASVVELIFHHQSAIELILCSYTDRPESSLELLKMSIILFFFFMGRQRPVALYFP